MSPVTAIGFDLGETLLTYVGTPLNWTSLYSPALARVAENLGASPTSAQLADATHILVRSNTRLNPRREEIAAAEIFRAILLAWGLRSEDRLGDAIAAFFGFFQQRLQPYPETSAVLSQLRERGIRIGVLTDVPYGMPRPLVERDLADAGLTAGVDELLVSVEVGWRKPEPAGFHALAKKLRVTSDELWYVGNEEKDIVGALAVGATAVLIDREHRRPAWGQDHTVSDLRELLPLL